MIRFIIFLFISFTRAEFFPCFCHDFSLFYNGSNVQSSCGTLPSFYSPPTLWRLGSAPLPSHTPKSSISLPSFDAKDDDPLLGFGSSLLIFSPANETTLHDALAFQFFLPPTDASFTTFSLRFFFKLHFYSSLNESDATLHLINRSLLPIGRFDSPSSLQVSPGSSQVFLTTSHTVHGLDRIDLVEAVVGFNVPNSGIDKIALAEIRVALEESGGSCPSSTPPDSLLARQQPLSRLCSDRLIDEHEFSLSSFEWLDYSTTSTGVPLFDGAFYSDAEGFLTFPNEVAAFAFFAPLEASRPAFTLAFRFQLNNMPPAQDRSTLLIKQARVSDAALVHLFVDKQSPGDYVIRCEMRTIGNGLLRLSSRFIGPSSKWHEVFLVRNENLLQLFVNGEEGDVVDLNVIQTLLDIDEMIAVWTIGAMVTGGDTHEQFFHGGFDSLKVYGRALSASDFDFLREGNCRLAETIIPLGQMCSMHRVDPIATITSPTSALLLYDFDSSRSALSLHLSFELPPLSTAESDLVIFQLGAPFNMSLTLNSNSQSFSWHFDTLVESLFDQTGPEDTWSNQLQFPLGQFTAGSVHHVSIEISSQSFINLSFDKIRRNTLRLAPGFFSSDALGGNVSLVVFPSLFKYHSAILFETSFSEDKSILLSSGFCQDVETDLSNVRRSTSAASQTMNNESSVSGSFSSLSPLLSFPAMSRSTASATMSGNNIDDDAQSSFAIQVALAGCIGLLAGLLVLFVFLCIRHRARKGSGKRRKRTWTDSKAISLTLGLTRSRSNSQHSIGRGLSDAPPPPPQSTPKASSGHRSGRQSRRRSRASSVSLSPAYDRIPQAPGQGNAHYVAGNNYSSLRRSSAAYSGNSSNASQPPIYNEIKAMPAQRASGGVYTEIDRVASNQGEGSSSKGQVNSNYLEASELIQKKENEYSDVPSDRDELNKESE